MAERLKARPPWQNTLLLLFLLPPPLPLVWTQYDSDSLLRALQPADKGNGSGRQRLRLADTLKSDMFSSVRPGGQKQSLLVHLTVGCCMTDSRHKTTEFQWQITPVAGSEDCDSASRSLHQDLFNFSGFPAQMWVESLGADSELIGNDFQQLTLLMQCAPTAMLSGKEACYFFLL